MELITAKFQVVTPMFLGESGSVCADSIRGSSVKGALRAAFRALSWARIRSKKSSDDDALKQLHREESDLFGAAAGQNTALGQAKFLLRVKTFNSIRTSRKLTGETDEIKYLLGMGLYPSENRKLRDHIAAGGEFELELALKSSLTAQQKQQLIDTIKLFGFLGNLGCRARKGFGSVSLIELKYGDDIALPKTVDAFKDELIRLIGHDLPTSLPPLTAFSKHTHMQISATGSDAFQLLKKHGSELGRYRGFGRECYGVHKTFGQTSEANFKGDHDWAYDVAKGNGKAILPQRAVFGLPHPYRLSTRVNIEVDSSTGRRASPLFAHVHQLPGGQCLLVHSLLKAVFLPQSADVNVKTKGQKDIAIGKVDEQINWGVIETFLNRFTDKDVVL